MPVEISCCVKTEVGPARTGSTEARGIPGLRWLRCQGDYFLNCENSRFVLGWGCFEARQPGPGPSHEKMAEIGR